MDLDEIRRKRIKLFGAPYSRQDEVASSSTPQTSTMAASEACSAIDYGAQSPRQQVGHEPIIGGAQNMPPDISEDEKYARQLQAEIEEMERPQFSKASFVLPSHIANSLTEDEKLANQLHEQFGQEYSYMDASGDDPFAGIPGSAEMIAEDEKMARELQAEFDNISDHDYPPSRSRSLTPQPTAKLPPSPPDEIIMAETPDYSSDAVLIRDWADAIFHLNCAVCNSALYIDKGKLARQFSTILDNTSGKDVCFFAQCSACPGKTCPGCGDAITAAGVVYGSTISDDKHAMWHCDSGRITLIWSALCAFDTAVTHNKIKKTRKSGLGATADGMRSALGRVKGKVQKGTAGIGYSGNRYDYHDELSNMEYETDEESASPPMPKTLPKNHPPGLFAGYEDGYNFPTPVSPVTHSKKRYKRKLEPPRPAPIDPDDNMTTATLALLSAILPSPSNHIVPTEFDFDPPEVLASLLKRSSILDKAAALLHNDSLDNAAQTHQQYENLFNFMRTLVVGGPLMSSIVYEHRLINKAGHDLLKVSFGQPTRLAGEDMDTAKSLASSMKNLVAHSQAMLPVMQANGDTEDHEEQKLTLLCTTINECADLVAEEGSKLQSKAKDIVDGNGNKDEWQKNLRVVAVADDTILSQHSYAKEAYGLLNSNPPRRRLARISKELVALSTDLPAGIFIRHGETRPDVMKVVIIGPQDSPYENGMFEFDLFCPLEYPTTSPRMAIKTTGGGVVGFNPNLYADGTVCLSLLGTWEGEAWNPSESTLLQVLVSIQAMIFNDEPYCNEPGQDKDRGSEMSKSYNRDLYPSVVKFGMLEWIEGRRSKDPGWRYMGLGRRLGDDQKGNSDSEDIWAEVANKHFEVNAQTIIDTVGRWATAPPQKPSPKPKRKSVFKSHSYGSVFGNPFAGKGRTIGDEEGPSVLPKFGASGPSKIVKPKADDLKLEGRPRLIAKLEEAMEDLKANSTRYGNRKFDDYIDSDDEDGP